MRFFIFPSYSALSFRPAVYNLYLCMHFTCLTTKSSQLDRWKFSCDSDGSHLYLRLSIFFELEQMIFAWWWQVSLHFIDTKTYYFNSWQTNRLCMFLGPFAAGRLRLTALILHCLTLFDTSWMRIIAVHSLQRAHKIFSIQFEFICFLCNKWFSCWFLIFQFP